MNFDIIILGAGISGLLLGYELSKSHKTLLLEKDPVIPDRKYWLTNRESIGTNSQFISCIDTRYKTLDYIAYNGVKYTCRGEYYLWDNEKLLLMLIEGIKKNHGLIKTNSRFYSYKQDKDSILIFANNHSYRARIVIDCMGFQSPIINAKSMMQIIGYYILRGAKLKLSQSIQPVGLQNVIIDNKPKYLEVFPTKDGYAYTVLIKPAKAVSEINSIKEEFKYIINCTPYKNIFRFTDECSLLGGIIPIGIMKKRALERIFFFGESSQINPAATATGFTKMLEKYESVSKFIRECLAANLLSQNDLKKYNIHENESFSKVFQINLFKDILNWNSDRFLDLVMQMHNLTDEIINNIVFGALKKNDLLQYKMLVQLLRSRNSIVLKPLIKSILA